MTDRSFFGPPAGAGQPHPDGQSAGRVPGEILPPGTRVMYISVGRPGLCQTTGAVGEVVSGPHAMLGRCVETGRASMAVVYEVEFARVPVRFYQRSRLKPLPPEDEVAAHDRRHRDVELEVC